MEGTAIYNYTIMVNGCVPIGCLAENEEQAMERAVALLGKGETYEMKGNVFSHHTGQYSIGTEKVENSVIKSKKAIKVKSVVPTDLMTNVMDAFVKDKKIDL